MSSNTCLDCSQSLYEIQRLLEYEKMKSTLIYTKSIAANHYEEVINYISLAHSNNVGNDGTNVQKAFADSVESIDLLIENIFDYSKAVLSSELQLLKSSFTYYVCEFTDSFTCFDSVSVRAYDTDQSSWQSLQSSISNLSILANRISIMTDILCAAALRMINMDEINKMKRPVIPSSVCTSATKGRKSLEAKCKKESNNILRRLRNGFTRYSFEDHRHVS